MNEKISKEGYERQKNNSGIGNCCSPYVESLESINGICSECGIYTVDGNAFAGCSYSPVACRKCGWQPCDWSC